MIRPAIALAALFLLVGCETVPSTSPPPSSRATGATVTITGCASLTVVDAATLNCVASGGGPPAQTINRLAINPSAVAQGASVVVDWATSNASSVTLDGATVAASGSRSDVPKQSHTYTLTAKGSAPDVSRQASVTVSVPPTGNQCDRARQEGFTVRTVDIPFGSGATYPSTSGAFGPHDVIAFRIVVPASPAEYAVQAFDASISEYQGPPTARHAVLSKSACDFYRAPDKAGNNGPVSVSAGNTATVRADVGASKPMKPGETWYVSVRNRYTDGMGSWFPSCNQPDCNIIVGWQWPRASATRKRGR